MALALAVEIDIAYWPLNNATADANKHNGTATCQVALAREAADAWPSFVFEPEPEPELVLVSESVETRFPFWSQRDESW